MRPRQIHAESLLASELTDSASVDVDGLSAADRTESPEGVGGMVSKATGNPSPSFEGPAGAAPFSDVAAGAGFPVF